MKISKLDRRLYNVWGCVPYPRRPEVDPIIADMWVDLRALTAEVQAAADAEHEFTDEEERAIQERWDAITLVAIERIEVLTLIAA